MISIKFMYTAGSDRSVPAPERKSKGSSGWDIRANLPQAQRKSGMVIPSGKVGLVPTGIALEIPSGFECQIRSRSGLARDSEVFVLNAPGTVDSDFRGELCILLANFGNVEFKVKHGTRIAQLVFTMVPEIEMEQTEVLSKSERGSLGYGSTGLY